jgi:ATP-dependent RNA helicase DDX47/RRP3
MHASKKKKISKTVTQPVIEGDIEATEPSITEIAKPILLNDVIDTSVTWESLGISPAILKTLVKLKYKNPTKIQRDSIPYAIEGRDIIGIAQTGSGKTAAYVLPILHQLLSVRPSPASTLIISPTRELALQIKEHVDALGADIGLKSILLVGGVGSKNEQKMQIQKERPHIVIATPGRLVDHLIATTGFNLRNVKFLVMDEADKLLGPEFEKDMGSIFSQINTKERKTYLFSATMTKNVEKLLKVQMKDPVKVQTTDSKYATVDSIKQEYLFVPEKYKEVYLVYLLNENPGKRIIVFGGQSATVLTLSIMARSLGFPAVPLSGQMDDKDRTHCLRKFKTGDRPILIATDIAARGLDLPNVDLVVNFDIPTVPKEYVHRIGRTGRIGREGRAITIVSQYDVEYYQKIEKLIGKKMELCPSNKDQVMTLVNTVTSAVDIAKKKIRDREIRVTDDRGDEEEVIDSAIKILSQKRDEKRKENQKFKNKRDRSQGKSHASTRDDQEE